MKRLVICLCFFTMCNFLFADAKLVALRTELNEAAEDKTIAQSFFNKMSVINEQSPPLLIGFKAISILIMGKHSYNPYTKLKYFYWGKDLLDKAIEKEKSLELHFFRFAVQTNIPSFLPYTSDIQTDKKIIFSHLPTTKDLDLIKRIVAYMPSTKYCNEVEIKKLLYD